MNLPNRLEIATLQDISAFYSKIYTILLEKSKLSQANPEQTRQANQDIDKAIGQTDLFYFTREILGYKDLDYMHWQLCTIAMENNQDELYLLPREHLKTTLLTVARAVWWLAQNPNQTILIVNATLDNARAFLSEIKQLIASNDKLKTYWPQFDILTDGKPKNNAKWDESRVTILRDNIIREPSITVAGVGQSFASRHYDRIIFDDLLNEKNTESPEQIQKTIKWFQQVMPLVKKGGTRSVIAIV